MYELSLAITQQDIYLAKQRPYPGCFCPIARSIARYFSVSQTHFQVAVLEEKIEVYLRNNMLISFLPARNAQKFMEDFDEGRPVKPQHIEIVLQ